MAYNLVHLQDLLEDHKVHWTRPDVSLASSPSKAQNYNSETRARTHTHTHTPRTHMGPAAPCSRHHDDLCTGLVSQDARELDHVPLHEPLWLGILSQKGEE